MKTTGILLIALLLSGVAFSQQNKTTKGKTMQQAKTARQNKGAANQTASATNAIPVLGTPGNTITDKRLKGARQVRKSYGAGIKTNSSNDASAGGTFASGMHPAENAKQEFDSVPPANPNSISNRAVPSVTIPGINDTTINVHTLSENGIPTTSGAVDKSGQTQFGQTNWGKSRSTVGESQWTVPPPITASFNNDFPTVTYATWTRSNLDTSIYAARYQLGAVWVSTTYNAAGQRLESRSEIKLAIAPPAVHNYIARQPIGFKPVAVYRVEMTGKPMMYEIQSAGGKTIYLDSEGNEMKL